MSARPLVLVALGDAPAEDVRALLGAERVVVLGAQDSDAVLAVTLTAGQADVLWLPAWCAPGPDVAASVAAWRARVAATPKPSAARAALRLDCGGGTSVPVAPRLVLSSPGAVTLSGEEPRLVPGASVDDLADVWEVRLPDDLASHLEAVNLQSSLAARLRHAGGRIPAWRDLTLAPAAFVVRALAAVDGSRRRALPHLLIEAYRDVLVAAKLWELGKAAAA